MTTEQAEECYKEIIEVIKNPDSHYDKDDKEYGKAIDDAEKAREFYIKIIRHRKDN